MKTVLKIMMPVVFIALAVFLVSVLIKMKKERPPQTPRVVVPQAEVIQVDCLDHRPPVVSFGTARSYFETSLTPQVGGQITEVAEVFQVGRFVKKGDILARIDQTDYAAALARETSNLETARRVLSEEEIRAKQAAEDWVASGRDIKSASDFVLRKPQLAAAKAGIESAQAAVTKAGEDLERTIIRAPYDAVVLQRTASPGNYASSQQSLGTVVATERIEVRLPLTAAQAARIQLPSMQGGGESVQVTLMSATQDGGRWIGKLARIEPSLDPRNQVTYVIAEVKDPYLAKPEPLVVGTFVNVVIPAKVIPKSYKVPEAALVNDSFIWALEKEDKLCRIPAERIQSHDTHVYLKLDALVLEDLQLTAPLRVVTRPLSNYKQGIKVEPLAANPESSK